MKRGRHTPSEPGRAAGRQNLRPYGALTRAFNALRSHAQVPLCARLAVIVVSVVLMSVASPVMARVPVILDFGDSLTAGYGVPVGQAFPARLEAWLHERGIAARVV